LKTRRTNIALEKSAYLKFKHGDRIPDFQLIGTDDRIHYSKGFSGKAILIVFMCNHCPYVKPKVPFLVELQEKYQAAGLQIVAINTNNNPDYPEDSFPKMKAYSKKWNLNFLYLLDEDQQIAKTFDARCTPDSYLFNSEKKLVYHGRIDDQHGEPHSEQDTNELEDAIREVLETGGCTADENPSQGCSIKWNK